MNNSKIKVSEIQEELIRLDNTALSHYKTVKDAIRYIQEKHIDVRRAIHEFAYRYAFGCEKWGESFADKYAESTGHPKSAFDTALWYAHKKIILEVMGYRSKAKFLVDHRVSLENQLRLVRGVPVRKDVNIHNSVVIDLYTISSADLARVISNLGEILPPEDQSVPQKREKTVKFEVRGKGLNARIMAKLGVHSKEVGVQELLAAITAYAEASGMAFKYTLR